MAFTKASMAPVPAPASEAGSIAPSYAAADMESNHNPWDLRIPECDRFRGRATNLTRIKRVVEVIKTKLTIPQLEEFKKSIFGHFLEIDMDFKGMIMHNILLKLIVQTEDEMKSQLWFRIGGKLIRLSIREWCLVTGLRSGSSVQIDCETFNIRDNYFADILYGRLSDLDSKFLQFDFTEIPDSDALKISLYYFADRVLFARPDERRVQTELMNAVGDLDYFNNIPWGTLTWDIVRDQANRVLVGKVNKFKAEHMKDKRHMEEKYNFYGFCLGFQAWIFEAIGIVASKYAIKGDRVYPRIRRWKVRGQPTDMAVMMLLSKPDDELHTKQVLRPTKYEKNSPYWTSVRPYCTLIPQWVEQFERVIGDDGHSDDHVMDEDHAIIPEDYRQDNEDETLKKRRTDYVMRRLDNIDFEISSIRISMNEMSKQEDEFRQIMLKKFEIEMAEQRRFRDSVMSFINTYNNSSFTHSYDGPSYKGHARTTPIVRLEETSEMRDIEMPVIKTEETMTAAIPVTCDKSTKRRRFQDNIIVDERTEVDVDPMKGIDDPQLLVELNQWMAGVINITRPMKFVPSFYKIILGQEQDGWLEDEHINEYLRLISRRHLRYPNALTQKATHTDSWFFGFLKSIWEMSGGDIDKIEWNENIIKYYHGSKFNTLSKPWKDVDYVFIPINLNNTHWVCAQVCLTMKHIRIMDSYMNHNKAKDFLNMMASLQHILPKWLEYVGFYFDRPELNNDEPWKFTQVQGMPQQEPGSGDCGVFMLMYISYFMLFKLPNFDSSHASFFRKKMAVDIFWGDIAI